MEKQRADRPGKDAPTFVETSWGFPPVFLRAELQNQGSSPPQVKGAYLDVAESSPDPTPYLEVHGGEGDWCDADGSYNPMLDFQNLGWGEVKDARVIYSFGSAKKRTPKTP